MRRCASCGAELNADDVGDLCAVCLLSGGLATELPGAGAGATTAVQTEAADQPEHALEIDSFGPYVIQKVLGEGGMGTVYLAAQTHPIQRKVALKVVKPGMETRSILSRFEYERQALASMDHPNIARVYDASASGKGRPYFVMEYIDGEAITEYCDHRRLNTLERLELFAPVCQAVQHAHQKGVIHRDLKPSNILVTEQDGKPVPKVIDFGIAKATDQLAQGGTMLTQFGQFVGTPEYISPEQADLVANDVDTSSDVYSLGVVLYELLVGAVPFDGKSLRKAGMAELLRIVREDEAPSFAAKLTAMGGTVSEIAERRRTDPVSLRRQLAGDLNWIALKAVEKDRKRRYLSALELAADLRRYADDMPVLASPPSVAYRTRKFVKRHRGGVLAAGAVAVALMTGLIATAWEAREARRQRIEALAQKAAADRHSQEALAERARAEGQATAALKAKGVADERLADVRTLAHSMLFELDDQVRNLPGGTQARETLARLGMEYLNKVSEAAADDPRMRQELGAAYLKVGDLQGEPSHPNLRDIEGARKSYAEGIAILQEQLKGDPRNRELRHLLITAQLRKAQLEPTEDERKPAVVEVRKAAEKNAASDPADLQAQRDLADALAVERKVVDRWAECYPCSSPVIGDPYVIPLDGARQAVAIRERLLQQEPQTPQARWELASAQITLASAAVLVNPAQRQLELLHQALTTLDDLIKADPQNTQYRRDRAYALMRIARAEQDAGRMTLAEKLGRDALALMQQVADADPLNAAFHLDLSNIEMTFAYNRSKATLNKADYLEDVNRAVAIQEEQAKSQPDNPDFMEQAAVFHTGAGRMLVQGKDYDSGAAHYRRSESIYRGLTRAYPNEKYYQKRLAEAMSMIGDSLISTPNRAEAFSHYQESIALWEKLAGKSDLQGDCLVGLGKAHHKLAAAYHSASRFEEAITEYRAALAVFDRAVRSAPTPDEARGNAATVDNDLFQLYNSRNDYQHALEALLQARPFAEANYAAHPDHRAARSMAFIVYDRLSRAYNSLQRNEEALAAALREVQTAEDYARDPSPFWYFDYVSRSESRLGDTYLRLKRRADSLAALGKAVVVWDGLPRDFEITGNDLAQMAGDLNNAALFLRELDEEPLSWQACSKTVANIRTIISRNPLGDNPIEFAGSNVMFQRCSDIAGDRNDWESAIQLRTEWQKLAAEHPLPLAQFWRTLGDDQLKIGSAQDLLGRPEAAAKARMRAREYFLKMRDVAQGLVTSSQGKNLAALQSLVIANLSLSFLSEREGESKGAIEYAKTALDAAQKLAAADSRTPAFQSLLGDAKGTMARLQSLADPKAAVAPLDFASGWRAYANLCVSETFYPCLEEARRAVELGRKAASTAPSAESRNALALELSQLGASARVAAKNSRGAARRAALEQSIAANKECLDTVAALEREGLKSAIPPLNRQVIAVAVENAKAKLAAMDPAVDSARK